MTEASLPLREGPHDQLDVLVVGAGQAALALGYELGKHEMSYILVDGAASIGESWRSRWDSLKLFTPAQYDGLPGMEFPAPADTYPTKDAVAEFLRSYAESNAIRVLLDAPVTQLSSEGSTFRAQAGSHELAARQVVVATGPFQVPSVPGVVRNADPSLVQLHSSEYQNPDSLPPGATVLVVGGANSGCQIAAELARYRAVELAVSDRVPAVPQRFLGRDIWWWGSTLRVDRVTIDSRLGKRLSRRDPVIGMGPKQLSKRFDIRLRPKVEAISGRTVSFADGSRSDPDAVIWATGYRGDYSWIEVPGALDQSGRPVHHRGVSQAPGLYFLGLSWLWTRGSALLGWVGDDARYLGGRLRRFALEQDGTGR